MRIARLTASLSAVSALVAVSSTVVATAAVPPGSLSTESVQLESVVTQSAIASTAGVRDPVELTVDYPDSVSLGSAVALDGDTLVASDQYAETAGGQSGAVHVFVRDESGWTEQARLLPPSDLRANDQFGSAVDLDGDTIVVGVEDHNLPQAPNAGAVYVFTRADGTWTERQKITLATPRYFDRFGWSVDVEDDTLAVGARMRTVNGVDNAGAAYVYARDDAGRWVYQDKLSAPDLPEDGHFGSAVGLQGDTVLVGAEDAPDERWPQAGAVYVFRNTGSDWEQVSEFSAPTSETFHEFGAVLAVDGDTAVVGGGLGAQVFVSSDGISWTHQASLNGADSAVAIDGDRIVIASDEVSCEAGPKCGKAHIYSRSGTTWTKIFRVIDPEAEPYDLLGSAVAVDGTSIVVAQRGNDPNGSVYVFGR